MKKIIAFTLFLSCIFSAFSQVSVFTKFSETGKVTPCVTIFGTKPIVDKVNLTYFSLVQEGWAEAQLGLAYSPTTWSNVGLSCGFEQLNGISFRTGCSLWIGKDKTSFLFLGEKGQGADNYWYKTSLMQNLSKNFNLGVRAWRFTGIGPLVEYKTGKLISKIWAMPAYNFEASAANLVIGFDIKM